MPEVPYAATAAVVRYEPSTIAGVGRIATPFFDDVRGAFTKVFGAVALESAGINFDIHEVYWSRSQTGVIRGLHYQNPPAAVAKIVFIAQGRIRDMVLDLRTGSPTYLRIAEFELTERSGVVVVPQGCAHGFEVLDGPAVTCYLQDGPFDAASDTGVRWDTAGIIWKTAEPIVSDRDKALPRLDSIESPFGYRAASHVG